MTPDFGARSAYGPCKGRYRCASAGAWYRLLETNLVRAREYVVGGMMTDVPQVPDAASAKGSP
jgi:hypothetical protein